MANWDDLLSSDKEFVRLTPYPVQQNKTISQAEVKETARNEKKLKWEGG